MKKLLAVLVAATFAATSFAALAQDKGTDKKGSGMEKKSSMDKKDGKKKGEGKKKSDKKMDKMDKK